MIILVNREMVMRFAVALIAASAIGSPALATHYFAGSVKNAVETFEEYNVGDIVQFRYSTSNTGPATFGGLGSPTPFLHLHGVIEQEANGNKYIELFNTNPYDKHIGYARIDTVGWLGGGGDAHPNGPGPHPRPGFGVTTTYTLHSMDVLSQNGGGAYKDGAAPFAIIPAGGWHTVPLNYKASTEGYFTLNGPGFAPFKLDNIRYSAFTIGVPEPASWAMMIAGFGAVGATMRRRRPMQPA